MSGSSFWLFFPFDFLGNCRTVTRAISGPCLSKLNLCLNFDIKGLNTEYDMNINAIFWWSTVELNIIGTAAKEWMPEVSPRCIFAIENFIFTRNGRIWISMHDCVDIFRDKDVM
eukprot:TRINITY_DN11920_c0_g1_i11.p2 TRINITY_DN11920_c0_g1~~TRINITY_DN11920_c0_g1_i11.p2  ORF type:complete len:114 (-),score=3.97 TRINITY_DN11920_c0_g1_i11:656-997(-)